MLSLIVPVVVATVSCSRSSDPVAAAESARTPAADKPLHDDDRTVSEEARAEMLTRAHVWQEPSVPVAQASLLGDEDVPRQLHCLFKLTSLGGTTPKFDCALPDGEELRIKYGKGPEIPAEAATTRLLRALGFAADRVELVESLRCYGCPKEPFSTMKAVEITRAAPLYERVIDHEQYEDFDWVAVERKLDARPIETDRMKGWAFFELKQIDPARGGAPRAQVDALRLLAVFLAHWDNKAENQRLVCLTRHWPDGTACPEPFLLIQDTGATWGPGKVDLDRWKEAPLWDDRARCLTSMREFPYAGATFEPVEITEGGRQLLARLLNELTDRQLTELFTGARFDQKRGLFNTTHPAAAWINAFKAKRRQITDGPSCPTA